jgi:hypothetical protein
MRKELELKLSEKYPLLFRDKDLPPTQTLMCFGCECADGWYNILDHLFGYLTFLTETIVHIDYTKQYKTIHKNDKDYYEKYCSYKLTPPQIILDQVKEKYGTLRVYYHTTGYNIPEEIKEILDDKDLDKKLNNFYNKIDYAIDYAEYQSSVTCEITGKEGKLYTKGWHRTLCDEEAINNGYVVEDGGKLKIEIL